MGLMFGIASTAGVMVRAVRELRRQIGTLRALGLGHMRFSVTHLPPAVLLFTASVERPPGGAGRSTVTYPIVAASASQRSALKPELDTGSTTPSENTITSRPEGVVATPSFWRRSRRTG